MSRRFAVAAGVVGLVLASVGVASAATLGVRASSLASLTATVAQPPALTLALANGGSIAGRPEDNDIVRVTLPLALDAPTMCSTWSNAATTQSITGNSTVGVTITNGSTGNDVLTVVTTCSGWAFGSIDLGGTGYVTATATFGGNGSSASTVSYNPTTRVLTITLGARASGTAATVTGAKTAVFTPSATLKWQDGNTVAPSTGTSTGVQL